VRAPMLTVYHRPGAGRPIRLVWALEEAGADYDLVVITPEEGKSPEHLARQPLGRVPALVDDEGPLFESTALCLHIGELYPESGLLAPDGSHERALIQQWSIFAMTEIEPAAIESMRTREPDPERSAKAAGRAAAAAAAAERALAGEPPYLVGSRLTIADIVAGSVLRLVVRREVIEPSSLMAEYLSSLAERPAHARALARLGAA
jgi:glutathione S-transferase